MRESNRATFSHLGLFDYGAAFVVLLVLNFFLLRLMPGDPLTALAGDSHAWGMTEEARATLATKSGLDSPLWQQFLVYINSLARLDLGFSSHFQAPVMEVIIQCAPWTFLLVGTILALTMAAGLFLGIEAAWSHGRPLDLGLMGIMVCLNSLPPFVLAMFALICFGYSLGLFPLAGATEPFTQARGFALLADIIWYMALPVSAMFAHVVADLFFLTRGSAVTVVSRPFIRVGTAKGLGNARLKYHYLGLNALAPVVSRTVVLVSNLLTGVLFVEVVFSYPGLGLLAYEAVMNHDYPLAQGVFLIIGVIIFAVNIMVDRLVKRLQDRG